MSESRLLSEFRPRGTGYELDFPEIQTTFIVSALKRESRELHGQLTVRTRLPNARTFAGGVMHQSRVNLESAQLRRNLGKQLAERAPSEQADTDWAGFLEQFFHQVIEAERIGLPFVDMSTTSAPMAPPFLMPPLLLDRQVTFIYGDGGVGKSLLALAIAISVKTGHAIIPGMEPRISGDVLYLDWETDWETQDGRMRSICTAAGIPPTGPFYRQQAQLLHTDVESVMAHLEEHPTKLVVIDSVGLAGGVSDGDPADAAVRMFGALARIRALGAAVLCIDHIAYAQLSGNGPSKPYGSSYKKFLARSTWELRQARDTNANGMVSLGLFHTKSNNTARHDPIGLTMLFTPQGVSWTEGAIEGEGLVERLSNTQLIESLLTSHPMTQAEIVAATGISTGQVSVILQRGKGRRWVNMGAVGWGRVGTNS